MTNLPQNINAKSITKKIKNALPKHCSNCGHKYSDENLSLISNDEFSIVFHLTCTNCKEAYLINVISPQGVLQGSNRMPFRVDISSPLEAKRFFGGEFVTSKDVVFTHKILKSVNNWEELAKYL